MEVFPMHRAAEDGDIKKVKLFVEDDMSVDSPDNSKHTPLHWAAKCGHLKVVKFLISQKSDLDLKTKKGCTALLLAAECGHKNIVELLLRSGADGNCCSEIGNWTVLHHASRRGWTETVELLVENRNTKLDAKTTLGATSLLLAAYEGHADVIELLIQAGANVSFCDADSWTVLHYASKSGWLHIVKKTVEKKESDVNAKNSRDMNPLLLAACEGQKDVVEFLIEVGSSVDCHSRNMWTVLHYAANRGWLHIVKKIVKKKECDIDARTNGGMVPLILAAYEGHKDVVELLIEAGADVNWPDIYWGNVLHYASKGGWLQIVKKILKITKSILNSKNSKGNTPLHLACGMHNNDIINELLKVGADTSIKNNKGESAFMGKTIHEAAGSGDVERLELLIQLGVSIESRDHMGFTALHQAALSSNLKAAKFLIDNNCNLNPKGDDDETPLLVAAIYDHEEFVDLLLRSGADVRGRSKLTKTTVLHTACGNGWKDLVKRILERDNVNVDAESYGSTPLFYAVEDGYVDVTKLLLQAGANIHACNSEGETVLHVACVEQDVDVEMVKTLLLAGADANLKNNDNETAFHIAVEQEEPCLEVVKLLIEHGAYFRYSDNDKISKNSTLKELVLRDVDLCTQLLINKFNHQSLPEVYKNLKYVEKLPRIYTLNIWNSPGIGGGIAKCVESEIETKTFCDVMKVRPMVLTLLCVQALINPQKIKKKRPTHQGPVKRSARLALLNMEGSAKKKC